MNKVSVGRTRLALAKELKKRVHNGDINLFREYIESLVEERYRTLLKSTDKQEMSLLVGELRAYEKLLSSISVNEGTTEIVPQVVN
jgi:hypothetical protein